MLVRPALLIFLPVWFGAGIAAYFALTVEPPILVPRLVASFLLAATLISFKLRTSSVTLFLWPLLLAASGMAWVQYYSHQKIAPVYQSGDVPTWVRANVEQIEPRPGMKRLILTDLDFWRPETGKFPAESHPRKIRLNVRTPIEATIKPGDRVQVTTILSPPPGKPVYPNGYHFGRYAFFEEIGGVGYSISPVKRLKYDHQETLSSTIHTLRTNVTERIRSHFPEDKQREASIATALLTGVRGDIPRNTLESFRTSGLGHLLAISGLHMAMVMAGAYLMLRLFMAAIPPLALRFNIKKISALCAIFTGLFYLLLTGMPISAQRAYIMASMFFFAILVNRTGTPMLPVAWAALLILIIRPDAIITPGFQMSFAAVIALVATYDWLRHRLVSVHELTSFQRFLRYTGGILLTSFIAGLATTPIGLYHFGYLSNYGLLANLLAVPLTSFWVMPLGVLGLLTMPFSLDGVIFTLMGWGISYLSDWAEWVTSLEGAKLSLVKLPLWIFVCGCISGLIACLIKQAAPRLIALISFFIIFACGFLFSPQPHFLISGEADLFAITQDNALLVNTKQKGRYIRSKWEQYTGLNKSKLINDKSLINYSDKKDYYQFDLLKHSALILMDQAASPPLQTCIEASFIIQFFDAPHPCPENQTATRITQQQLHEKGTHAVTLSHPPQIYTVADAEGQRPWTR